MKKILIVGVSSCIGSNLAISLRRRFHVWGTYSSYRPQISGVASFHLEITAKTPLHELVQKLKPDFVIYCAAQSNFVTCENEPTKTLFLHAQAPEIIAKSLKRYGAKMVYLSSSKVFSGAKGNYVEEDETQPTGVYGRTKQKAEEALGEIGNVTCLRLGTVFGFGSLGQRSILNRLMGELWAGKQLSLVNDEYRSFCDTNEVSQCIEKLIASKQSHPGIFHIAGDEKHTYFEFGTLLAKTFDFPSHKITGVSGREFTNQSWGRQVSERGNDLSLNGSKFSATFSQPMHSLEKSLLLFRDSLRKGTQ